MTVNIIERDSYEIRAISHIDGAIMSLNNLAEDNRSFGVEGVRVGNSKMIDPDGVARYDANGIISAIPVSYGAICRIPSDSKVFRAVRFEKRGK
jgi:hypothetical protein